METIIADTPEKILAYRLLTMRSALKLESLGMKSSRGSVAKAVRHFIGSRTRDKRALLNEFETHLRGISILQ